MVQRSWISGLSLALVPLVIVACGDDAEKQSDADATVSTDASPDSSSTTATTEDSSGGTEIAPDTTADDATEVQDDATTATEVDATEPDTTEPEYVYDPVPGRWDPAFDFTLPGLQAPIGPRAYTMVKDPDGNVYVGGIFDHAGPLEVQNVVKWTAADGFTAMAVGLNMTVHTLALDAAGHVFAAGRGPDGFIGGPGTISEWDGTAWTSLGMYEQFTPVWTSLFFNGDLIIGGEFSAINAPDFSGSVEAAHLARWNGAEWKPIAEGSPNGPVHAMVVHAGELCVGGNFTKVGTVDAQNIACLGADGWHAVGDGLNSQVNALYSEGAESLMAGGYFSFGDPSGPLTGPDAGFFVGLGRFTSGDTEWKPVAGGVIDGFITNVTVIAPAGDDGVFIGGNFVAANAFAPVIAHNIALLDGNNWLDIGGLSNELGVTLGSEVGPRAIVPDGEGYLVAGLFSTAGGVSALNIVRYQQKNWQALVSVTGPNLGIPGLLNDIRFGPDGALYAGGYFTGAGGVTTPNVGKLVFPDVQGIIPRPPPSPAWVALGDGIPGSVYEIAPTRTGKVYAGGDFIGLARLDETVAEAEWDYPGELDGTVNAIVEGPEGDPHIYIGGGFSHTGQTELAHIARFTGSTFQPLGVGLNDRVNAILIGPAGEVYAGGFFTGTSDYDAEAATGAPLAHLAKWNGTGWEDVGGGVDAGDFGYVTDLAWYEGDLLVVGSFREAGDRDIYSIARWDGGEWSPVGDPGIFRYDDFDAPLPLSSVTIQPNGFWLTGSFGDKTIDGTVFNHIAWWNGSGWETLGTGFNDLTEAVAVAPDGRSVFIGGPFLTAGGEPSLGIAHWLYDDETGTLVEP